MVAEVALIGGSGLYVPRMFENAAEASIDTPYGQVDYVAGELNGKAVVFIARHDKSHGTPPHKINYRANIWALKKLGVKFIAANSTAGSLNPDLRPGDLVIPDQLLDFTKNRPYTFFDGQDRKVVHVDFTRPFCHTMSELLLSCAPEANLTCHAGGVYVCTEGPRFETAAEIKMYGMLGGDIVGMTGVPEAVLAREAEMCYVNFSLVTNMGAGISKNPLSHREVHDYVKSAEAKLLVFIKNILVKLLEQPEETDCDCQRALWEVGGFKL